MSQPNHNRGIEHGLRTELLREYSRSRLRKMGGWRHMTELGSVVLDGWICEHSGQPDMGRYCKTINLM